MNVASNTKGNYNVAYKKGSRLAPIAPTTSLSNDTLHQQETISQEENVKRNLQNEIDNRKEREVLAKNEIPVEIQLHTKISWKLKSESDLFYDQYRSYSDLENQLTNEEYQ